MKDYQKTKSILHRTIKVITNNIHTTINTKTKMLLSIFKLCKFDKFCSAGINDAQPLGPIPFTKNKSQNEFGMSTLF